MDVLYCGLLNAGNTCSMRKEALERAGHSVTTLDLTPSVAKRDALTRLAYRAAWRFGWALDIDRCNERLMDLALEIRPEVIWVDKGVVITPSTLRQLTRELQRTRLVHYNPDDPFGGFGYAGWRTFIRAIREYDVHIVPRRANVEEYRRHGARHVFQAMPAWGYAEDIHRPVPRTPDAEQRFGADVGFVGSFEADRAQAMLELARKDVQVRIVGPWPAEFLDRRMLHTPGAVMGGEYARALGSFKIALGFLRKKNRDRHTSRSIEIPACGVFMLAERSDEHLSLFEEGIEAEYFSDIDELTDKVRFYLANDRARERIAAAGRSRCERSGYGNMSCMQRLLTQAAQ
jgi:spore maturation protein CgeB